MNAKVTVYLRRAPQFMDVMRKYQVFLDGVQIGEISRDETLNLSVEPGEHMIRLKLDWTTSNTLMVNAREGEDVYLECGNNVARSEWWSIGLKLIAALTVARDSYLYVRRE
jgi:hypothetical protein